MVGYSFVVKSISDTYDCVAISGGMGESHIPCSALHELIRITKPGEFFTCILF